MTTLRKLLCGTGGTLLVGLTVPIIWSAFNPHAYFENGRCSCGHRILVRLKEDGYYSYSPGHGMPEHRDYGLRRTDGGWELFALPQPEGFWSPTRSREGTVVARLRRDGGDLWESWGSNTNWVRLPRVYNMWRVWLAGWLATAPQKITCVNNLKQIGLSFRIWAGDNYDQYPFNLSTNAGGTMELCARDTDGFDRNAWLHLLVLSNELNTPKVLVCPQDRAKKAATNFSVLRAENVSYRVRSGAEVNETNAQAVLAVCPVEGNTVFCDGRVVEGKDLRGKH